MNEFCIVDLVDFVDFESVVGISFAEDQLLAGGTTCRLPTSPKTLNAFLGVFNNAKEVFNLTSVLGR